MDKIIIILSIVLVFGFWLVIIRKLVWNRYAPVKTVQAEVVDKYKANIVSKYPGVSEQGSYIVVFKTKDEKLSFNVSAFSYDSYRIKEKGTLTYKGNQIISFQ